MEGRRFLTIVLGLFLLVVVVLGLVFFLAPDTFSRGIFGFVAVSEPSNNFVSASGNCSLVGDNPPCDSVALSELVSLINQWVGGHATLRDVVRLINVWAGSPATTTSTSTTTTTSRSSTTTTSTSSTTTTNSQNGSTYYVSTAGNNSNNGLSQGTAWRTISYAVRHVVAGDRIYVRAGNYGSEEIVPSVSGTAGNPIVIEGRDINWGAIPEPGYYDIHAPSGLDPPAINSSLMPLIDGGNVTDIGIDLSGRAYLEVKNIQITRYVQGVSTETSAQHLTLNNLLITNCGWDGISLYDCDYCNIFNSIVSDSEMANIIMAGARHSLIENCRTHDMPGGIVTDYYIILGAYTRSSYDNTIRHCYAELDHKGVDGHSGHGIGFKGEDYNPDAITLEVYNNTVVDCVSWTMNKNFYVRHGGVHDNTFINCTSYNACNTRASCGAFVIRDGACNNTFINCRAVNNASCIDDSLGAVFFDSDEDGDNGFSGKGNVFENCIFDGMDVDIAFDVDSYDNPALDNLFTNCVFINNNDGALVYHASANNTGNRIQNSIITGLDSYEVNPQNGHVNVSYSIFWNNAFAAPSGTRIITANPLFVNATNHNFHHQPTSPAIDNGTSVNAPNIDMDNNPRPEGAGYDIGAYEY
jgi:parallel beta-helix repeat protein